MKGHWFGAVSAVSVLVGGVASAAEAQDEGYRVEEIVVTAQKRDEALSEVPIAITAVNGEALNRAGVNRVENIFVLAPSVSFQGSQSSAGSGLRIRGVGSAAFNAGTEQSVSTIIDGLVTGPAGSGLADLYDIERIEVLRGPQGTLFGKNSSAGAVNVVTRAPTQEFSGYGVARYGVTLEDLRLEGAVSGEIVPGLTGRVAGFKSTSKKSFVRNTFINQWEDTRDRYGMRGHLRYENGGFDADLIVSYEQHNDECCTRTFVGGDPVAYNAKVRNFLLPILQAQQLALAPGNRRSISNYLTKEDSHTVQAVANLAYSFDNGLTLRSITGGRRWSQNEANDADRINIDTTNYGLQRRNLKLFSEELQLVSPSEGALRYIVGLYYYDQSFDEFTTTGGGADYPPGGFPPGQYGNTYAPVLVKTRNVAAFADASYDFAERWQVFGGLRLLHERISAAGQRYGNYYGFPGTYRPAAVSADDNNWVGRFGVRYMPEGGGSYYATVSRGYKGRAIDVSFNSPFFIKNQQDAILRPETVVNYELGAKTRLFDGRVALNGALFLSRFTDYQSAQFDSATSAFLLRNAGMVETKGVEVDFQARPWTGMDLSGGFAYVDSVFKEYKGAPCTAVQNALRTCPVGGQDLSGQQVNASPKWQYNIAAQQSFPLSDDVTGYVRGEWSWRSEVTYGGDLNPATRQPAYGLANFRAGVKFGPGERYEVGAFVENAFDEDYAIRIIDAVGWAGAYQAYQGQLRTWGVELRAEF